jgi:hypothetical protein
MNYHQEYIKYKRKYLMLKKQLEQSGSGIEEYDDQSKPVIQSLFTDLNNTCIYYHPGNAGSRQLLNDLIKPYFDECMMITVRGNGACLLNAFCTSNFIKRLTLPALLAETAPAHNKSEPVDQIAYGNTLNLSITDFCKSTYARVSRQFEEYTELILRSQFYKMNPLPIQPASSASSSTSAAVVKPVLPVQPEVPFVLSEQAMLNDFHRSLESSSIHTFKQLGQIMSTISGNTVMISVDINPDRLAIAFNGIYPNEETIKASKEEIYKYISEGTWDVVFVINPSGRHYNSFIPIVDREIIDIKILNLMAFERIKDLVVWQ